MLNPRKAIKMGKATLEERSKKNQENYELKVTILRNACEEFIGYLGNEKGLEYADVLKKFKDLFSLQLKKPRMLSRTSRVLNKMSKELSKFEGNFSSEGLEKYSEVFKYKREKVNEKSKFIKRSAIDDEKVYKYFTEKISGIFKGKANELKELEKAAKDAKKTSKENESQTKYVIDEKSDFEKVKRYKETLKNVSLVGSEIKGIPEESFSGFGKLERVSLSEKCKEIGARAFATCVELKNIDLSKVTKIGASAFLSCRKLKEIDLSSIESDKTIEDGAFSCCDGLKTVILPSSRNNQNQEKIRIRGIRIKVLKQVRESVAKPITITFKNDPDTN